MKRILIITIIFSLLTSCNDKVGQSDDVKKIFLEEISNFTDERFEITDVHRVKKQHGGYHASYYSIKVKSILNKDVMFYCDVHFNNNKTDIKRDVFLKQYEKSIKNVNMYYKVDELIDQQFKDFKLKGYYIDASEYYLVIDLNKKLMDSNKDSVFNSLKNIASNIGYLDVNIDSIDFNVDFRDNNIPASEYVKSPMFEYGFDAIKKDSSFNYKYENLRYSASSKFFKEVEKNIQVELKGKKIMLKDNYSLGIWLRNYDFDSLQINKQNFTIKHYIEGEKINITGTVDVYTGEYSINPF